MIYLYGVVPAPEWKEPEEGAPIGIDGTHSLYVIRHRDLLAVVCEVDAEAFSQACLDQLSQDPVWVQDKALHHHDRITDLQRDCTVIPMSFCTVFSEESRVLDLLNEQHDAFASLLKRLSGKREWNLKVYTRTEKLRNHLIRHDDDVRTRWQEIEAMSAGQQFFTKKKAEQWIAGKIEGVVEQFCERLREEFAPEIEEFQVKSNWSKAVTGRQEEMVFNGVFLISDCQKDSFVEKVRAYGSRYESSGWVIESTGPWPPYHFAKLKEAGSVR